MVEKITNLETFLRSVKGESIRFHGRMRHSGRKSINLWKKKIRSLPDYRRG